MFTGIVEEVGEVSGVKGDRYVFAATRVLGDVRLGDSIAVDGCCLTVVEHDAGSSTWSADISSETRRRTTLDRWAPGQRVNLERAARVGDRLGGHVVQGHVDAIGEVVVPAPDLRVRLPEALLRYVVEKGSIAIDGVSLTVATVHDDGVTIALIPHTCAVTTLGDRAAGDPVNIEVDIMAKYVERLATPFVALSAGA